MAVRSTQKSARTLTPTQLHNTITYDLGIDYKGNFVRIKNKLSRFNPRRRIVLFLSILSLAYDDGHIESKTMKKNKLLHTLGVLNQHGHKTLREMERNGVVTQQDEGYTLDISNPEKVVSALKP